MSDGEGGAAGPPVVVGEEPDRATRAPSDVLRLVVGVVLLVVTTVVGALFGDGIAAFVSKLLRGLDQLPAGLLATIGVVGQVAAVVVLGSVVILAVRQRSARLLLASVVAAGVSVALVVATTSLVVATADPVTDLDPIGAAGATGTWPAILLAALTAVVATVTPWTRRRWRRVEWLALLCIALVLFACGPIAFHTLLAVLAGWTAGTAATVLFGSPSHRPPGSSVIAGMAAADVQLARLEQVGLDARGSTPYFGEATDGARLFVKVLGRDERSADLLFRAFRRLQPRDLGDQRPFSSLRRTVEHEALLSCVARDAGVRTPRLVALAAAGPDGFALAYEAIAGRSLDRVAAAEVTDAVLDGVWSQVGVLRRHGIAHRDLRLANVFLADDAESWIIDFGFSELAASDLLLTTDLAELIASSSLAVGPERAVAAAERAVGRPTAVSALGRLRPALLSGATRSGLKAAPGSLDELRRQLT